MSEERTHGADAPGPGPGEPDVWIRAQDVFAGWLESLDDGGEAADFELLCARHPALAGSLRVLHRTWRSMEEVFDDPGERLRQPTRIAADASSAPGGSATIDRVLAAHGPRGDGPRYVDERPIARGGMGEITAVFDTELGRTVAKKTLIPDRPGGQSDPARLRRFLDEARVTAQLDHPNVIPLLDLGLDGTGRPYFTMSLVRGVSLRDALKEHRSGASSWPRSRLLDALIQVCDGMAHAHDRGVVHRDLKPANVMLGRFGEVYVIDWGLAALAGSRARTTADGGDAAARDREPEAIASLRRRFPELVDDARLYTVEGAVVGTPAYMSPEQARGLAAEPPTDIYAVGAMLYELLSGSPPYGDSGTGSTVLQQVLELEPRPLPARGVPPQLAAICQRAMARDPSRRYPTMQALRDDLVAFRDLRAVQAYRTGAGAELMLWIARNRALAVVMACAAVGLAVGVVLLEQQRRRAHDEARTAEQGLRTAAESVDRMLSRIGVGILQSTPRATKVARGLFEDALMLRERILELRPDGVAARFGFARSLNHLAVCANTTGNDGFAVDAMGRAAGILRGLLDDPAVQHGDGDPALADVRRDLVANLVGVARIQGLRASPEASLATIDGVLDEVAGWSTVQDEGMTSRLARAHEVRGLALHGLGDDRGCREALEQAMALLRSTTALREEDVERALGLDILSRLALLARDAGDDAAVRAYLDEGLALLDARDLVDREVLRAAVDFLRRAAAIDRAAGRTGRQRAVLDRAVEVGRRLARDHPDSLGSHWPLALCLEDRARMAPSEGPDGAEWMAEAVREARLALELDPQGANQIRAFRHVTRAAFRYWIRSGQWSRAAESALVEVRAGTTPEQRLYGATHLAELIRRSDAEDPPLLEGPMRGVCRSAALRVVQEHRRRIARGEDSELESLMQREAWDVLRADPDFR